MKIDITGDYEKKTNGFIKIHMDAPRDILEKAVQYADNQMRANARKIVYSYVPRTNQYKRTGNTYRAIKSYYKGKNEAIISPDSRNGSSSIDYSHFIESGNKKTRTPARPYVRTTFDQLIKKVPTWLNKYSN